MFAISNGYFVPTIFLLCIVRIYTIGHSFFPSYFSLSVKLIVFARKKVDRKGRKVGNNRAVTLGFNIGFAIISDLRYILSLESYITIFRTVLYLSFLVIDFRRNLKFDRQYIIVTRKLTRY